MNSIRQIVSFILVVLLGIGVFIGCSDSTSPETSPGYLQGSVTNSDGSPITGAAVLVSFRPSFDDILQPQKSPSIMFNLPPTGELESALILDPCGQQVRVLCDGDCGESLTLMWDGLDDEGLRVEEGLFSFQLTFPDSMLSADLVLIHYYSDWGLDNCRNHGLTNSEGEFKLSDECLGFGTEIKATDEEGNLIDMRPIQRLINLHIVTADGRVARQDSIMWPDKGNKTVDFVISR